jgi:prepilin-type N-terminal cleavage/methylation domain-containing protein
MASSRRGFTLIELLIVVVIIGILAAIAIPKFANSKQKAYVAAMKSDLHSLIVAEEAFYADSERYTAVLDTTITGKKKRRTVTISSTGLIFESSTGVSMPMIDVGPGYWSATVTHSQIPNFTCGIGVNTTNPVEATANDGAPACK